VHSLLLLPCRFSMSNYIYSVPRGLCAAEAGDSGTREMNEMFITGDIGPWVYPFRGNWSRRQPRSWSNHTEKKLPLKWEIRDFCQNKANPTSAILLVASAVDAKRREHSADTCVPAEIASPPGCGW